MSDASIARTIGVSGHQHLSIQAVTALRQRLPLIFRDHRVEVAYSSLAAGADQVFAEAALSSGIELRVIVPSARYEDTFAEAEQKVFRALLARATTSVVLNFDAPCEHAFFAAGQRVVDAAGVLFAVWDGAPARGLGGTGDVVAYALHRGRRVLRFDPTTLAEEVL